MSALLLFLVAALIIGAVAFCLFWAADKLIPSMAFPAKVVIGVIAFALIVYKAIPLLT